MKYLGLVFRGWRRICFLLCARYDGVAHALCTSRGDMLFVLDIRMCVLDAAVVHASAASYHAAVATGDVTVAVVHRDCTTLAA
jgi:hypothetical protein